MATVDETSAGTTIPDGLGLGTVTARLTVGDATVLRTAATTVKFRLPLASGVVLKQLWAG